MSWQKKNLLLRVMYFRQDLMQVSDLNVYSKIVFYTIPNKQKTGYTNG
jgi:hypothetical protein